MELLCCGAAGVFDVLLSQSFLAANGSTASRFARSRFSLNRAVGFKKVGF